MRDRIRQWRLDTHGTASELVRHFLTRFFDNEMVTIPEEWQKVAVGLFAALVSVALSATVVYRARYLGLHESAVSFSQYQQAIREDLLSFVALGMAVTALLTILQWQSLFPSLRDCLALASLPVNPREVFVAKFSAVMLIFGTFVVSMTGMPAVLFATVASWYAPGDLNIALYLAANLAALAGGCAFVFFALLAIQGILLNLFKAHNFARASTALQAVLFVSVVGALPLIGRQPTAAFWWPPLWFANLWQAIVSGQSALGRSAILALTIPAVISLCAYLLSYQRYQKMLLESQAGHTSAHSGELGARALERWISDPREQAAFAFIWKTLFRSRSHRLFLLAYAGAALGWITKGLLDAPPVNLRDEGLYGLTVVIAPMAVSVLIVVGLRYLFALPVMLRASWVFQALEADARPSWDRAIERFVVWCGIVPVFLAGLPAAIAVLGGVRGAVVSALGCLGVLLFFERYFREFHKLPFTCSYLPGKQPIWALMVRFGVSSAMLGPIAQLFLWASSEGTAFLALSSGLAVLCHRWRGIRRRLWTNSPILWDEQPEAPVHAIDLQRAMDDDTPLSVGPLRPDVPEFGRTLTASRGLLPQEWSEEIDQERHSRAVWETLWEDIRYGARLIRRNPLLSAVVVLTLTVGIGINASVFTVVNGIALKPHVNGDPATFARIWPLNPRDGRERGVSYSEYIALRDRTRSVRQLAAFQTIPVLIGDDDSTGIPALAVSCNFFLVEQVDHPLLGRLLDADDCRTPGQMPVAIISESIWRNRFHATPGIIGQTARINNRNIPVVGVVPDRTSLWVQSVGVWMPYTSQPYFNGDRNLFHEDSLWLFVAGRLAPGYTRASAEAELTGLERQLDKLTPGRWTVVETTDGSWIETFNLRVGTRGLFLLTLFFGAFHLVLLIAGGERGNSAAFARGVAKARDCGAAIAGRAAGAPGAHADYRESAARRYGRRSQRLSAVSRAADALPLHNADVAGDSAAARMAGVRLCRGSGVAHGNRRRLSARARIHQGGSGREHEGDTRRTKQQPGAWMAGKCAGRHEPGAAGAGRPAWEIGRQQSARRPRI
ncbi:MAG: ABC transporter permease [Ignavibacteriota bacterium]